VDDLENDGIPDWWAVVHGFEPLGAFLAALREEQIPCISRKNAAVGPAVESPAEEMRLGKNR
jgi:hypothetical protein